MDPLVYLERKCKSVILLKCKVASVYFESLLFQKNGKTKGGFKDASVESDGPLGGGRVEKWSIKC